MFQFRMLVYLLPLTLLLACERSEPEGPIIEPIDPERVNFMDPQVGQFNVYEFITFTCGEPSADDNADLRLEITAVSPTTITFLESGFGLQDFEFTAERLEGGISISQENRVQSNLLFFYGDDNLRLTAEPTATVLQRDCVFFDGSDKFVGEYVASTPSFEVEGHSMENLKVVSCVPLILDLDGYLLYTENNLVASMTSNAFQSPTQVRAYVLR
ncbi:MAG: hypothetical protein AAF433_12385 [Bacteroidota bacterium]